MEIHGDHSLRFNELKKTDPSEKKKRNPETPVPKTEGDAYVPDQESQKEGSEVQQLKDLISELPEVRTERIEEVKERVAKGLYRFEDFQDALAEKLARIFSR